MKARSTHIRYGVILLLLLFLAQAAFGARQTSLTIDEGLHITSGYSILRTGDYRLIEEHPPLIKVWAALPLLPLHTLPDITTLKPWQEAAYPTTESLPLLQSTQQLLYPLRPFDGWLYPARIMVGLLGVLLGALIWRWTVDLGGKGTGLLALLLFAFDPNMVAHAAVAGTDVGAALFITLALFTLNRFLRRPTHPRLLLAGMALGLAQGAKLSALLLLPVSILILLLPFRERRLWRLTLYMGYAGITLWALYSFQIGHVPGVPVPLPAASHAIPWLRLQQHTADGHAAFLLGENSMHGWWYYFPVALALKTPLPTLLLFLWSVTRRIGYTFNNLRLQKRDGRSEESLLLHLTTSPYLSLLLFPLLYFVTSLLSPLNIGYRHLLPILPFLFIGTATGLRPRGDDERKSMKHTPTRTPRLSRLTQYALLVWLAFGTLRMAPHYLAFFNEIGGGAKNGWRHLSDSNTDWGQAYKDLAQFQAEKELGTLQLSAFIFYDPAVYGVDYTPLTPLRGDTPAIFPSRLDPPPGDYVMSTTTLNGIPMVDPEMYDWFRKREPDARIGHVLFYYHVPESSAGRWLAQCNVPVVPLTSESAHEGLGADALRLITFDCTQTWIYPNGGQSRGWYARRLNDESVNFFTLEHLGLTRLAYEQRIPRKDPPFALYEWDTRSRIAALQTLSTDEVALLPAGHPPSTAEIRATPPLELEGPLMFLGYRIEAPHTHPPVLWTYWTVTEANTRPFSIMAHALDDTGQLLATGDGLGVSPDTLLPGDLLIQRHVFTPELGHDTAMPWLQVGAYWLDSLERWEIITAGEDRATEILLTPFQ